jgi:ABC-type oligopeptide transport system substrate-binding subunit
MRTLALATLALLIQEPKETHFRAIWGSPASLDPALAPAADGRFISALFTGLTTFGDDGVTVAPGAAASWTVSDDGLTWTFTLADAKWTNGRAVTAEDFRFAWMRCLTPELACPSSSSFSVVRNADAFRFSRLLDTGLIEWDTLGPQARAALIEGAKTYGTKRHAKVMMALPAKGDETKGLGEAVTAAGAREDVVEASVGIAATDAKTLTVTLARPVPWFAETVAGPAWSPVPVAVVQEHRERWTDPGKIATNGPYEMQKWAQGDLVLVKSRAWKGKNPGPERVTLLLTAWSAEAMARYDRKDADWIAGELVFPEKIAELEKKGEWRSWPLFHTWYLRLNTAKAPFDNAGLRRWLALVLDRDKLAEAAKRAGPASSLVPPGVAGYAAAKARARDLAGAWGEFARECPDASKLPKLNVLVPKPYAAVADAIKSQIEADFPDVRVRVDAPDWPGYAASMASGDYHVAVGAWSGEALDPAPLLQTFAKAAGAEFDSFVEGSFRERDRGRRLEMLSKAEVMLLDSAVVVPFGHGRGGALARSKVKFAGNPFDRMPLGSVRVE